MADLKDQLPPARLPVQSPPRKAKRRVSEPLIMRRNPCRSARFNPLSSPRTTRQRRGSVSSSVSSSSSSTSPLSSPEKLVVRFGFFRKKGEEIDNSDPLYIPEDEDEESCALPSPKRKARVDREVKSAEEITEEDLAMVAVHVSEKRYDSYYGTSCHQCRQKTFDMKTICRSESCVGVRGQFCGPCLRNRYGEDAKQALKDPDWTCPACRGICNCSFCRKKKGRSCTGIMIHLAREQGFDNVNEYLQSLKKSGR
ncbi:cell division cycle-associated 7-like protein isoform X2 [Liolophura sinensis]